MEFVEHIWENYDILRIYKDKKFAQTRLLYGTGLCEGPDGAEYCFVPTKRMEETEEKILEFYNKINTVDAEVEICNEIYHTTKIEGAKTTFKRTQEIHNGAPIDHSNYFSEMMVKGGFEATKYLNVCNNRITENTLIQMWNILTDGCCDNEDIKGEKYRTGGVGVGNHMGLRHEFLDEVMKDWIDYYNSEKLNDHPFIKAALLHVSYEMIHPFCDGNGRSGRLLMVNYLIGQGYDKCKAISFSKRIAENSNGYYAALSASDNAYFDCTPFIEFMTDSFANTMLDVLEQGMEEDQLLSEEESIKNNKSEKMSRQRQVIDKIKSGQQISRSEMKEEV